MRVKKIIQKKRRPFRKKDKIKLKVKEIDNKKSPWSYAYLLKGQKSCIKKRLRYAKRVHSLMEEMKSNYAKLKVLEKKDKTKTKASKK